MTFWDFCLALTAAMLAFVLGRNVGKEDGIKEGKVLGFRETQSDLSKFLAQLCNDLGISRARYQAVQERWFRMDRERLEAMAKSWEKKEEKPS